MSDLLAKCSVCQALVDEEDMFCPECGAEIEGHPRPADQQTRLSTCNFECAGCGASMSYDASAGTLRCPFCGSGDLVAQKDIKVQSPSRVLPFVVTRDQAVATMRAWLAKGFWRPSDLSEQALVVTMTPVFVPFWVFGAKTHTYWTADTSQTPAGARASWFPVAGEHRGHHAGLLVGASGALSARETMELCPFDLGQGVPPEQVDLENITVESFGLDRKFARPLARQGLEEREREACRQYVHGNARNVKVNIRLEGLTSEPMLLPVWIMAYRYREEVFRFLLNGQTGRATGHAPTSWRKIAAVIGLSIGGILALIAVIAIVAAIASAA